MPYLILSTDDPRRSHLRRTLAAAHNAYLDGHRDLVLAVAALGDDAGQRPSGDMILLDVETRTAAEAFHAADPYTLGGLNGSVLMTRCSTLFPDRRPVAPSRR